MALPVTGISNGLDCILLLIAWTVISMRLKTVGHFAASTVKYMRNYFFYFAVFNAIMSLPCLLIYLRPGAFPATMAWCYVIANVFLLISLSYLSRMELLILPQWVKFERQVIVLWVVLNIGLFGLQAYYIGLHNHPVFSAATGITQFHIPPFLGALLSVISLVAYLPGLILFIVNAVNRQGDQRTRSIMLALGILLIMVFGPLHAVATKWQIFLIADILNVLSLVFLTGGILYRLAPETSRTDNQTTAGTAAL